MKTATIAELHERLDEYLDIARSGEPVDITDDTGRVARLVPPLPTKERVEELIAAGRLRRGGNGTLADDFFTLPRAKFSSGSLLDALLEEREEGR